MRHCFLVIVLSLAACKTAPTTVSSAPDRQLFDHEPLTEEWKDWTPSEGQSTPVKLADEATAFDYWQVTDESQREEAWAAIFGLLGEVRRAAPADYDSTFRMLMTVLEPDPSGPQRLDATFFAAKPGAPSMFEGVGWRLWKELPSGASPSVTVWMRRFEASSEAPVEALVWFHGGFEEAKSLTLRIDGKDSWTMSLSDGIATNAATAISGESEILRGILLGTFWRPVVGAQYLETTIEKRDSMEETPPQQPRAMGMTLGDRDIDQVFTDSVFAPRLTVFPAKQKSQ